MKYLEIFGVGFHATDAIALPLLHHFWGSDQLIILEIATCIKDQLGFFNISPVISRISVYRETGHKYFEKLLPMSFVLTACILHGVEQAGRWYEASKIGDG